MCSYLPTVFTLHAPGRSTRGESVASFPPAGAPAVAHISLCVCVRFRLLCFSRFYWPPALYHRHSPLRIVGQINYCGKLYNQPRFLVVLLLALPLTPPPYLNLGRLGPEQSELYRARSRPAARQCTYTQLRPLPPRSRPPLVTPTVHHRPSTPSIY